MSHTTIPIRASGHGCAGSRLHSWRPSTTEDMIFSEPKSATQLSAADLSKLADAKHWSMPFTSSKLRASVFLISPMSRGNPSRQIKAPSTWMVLDMRIASSPSRANVHPVAKKMNSKKKLPTKFGARPPTHAFSAASERRPDGFLKLTPNFGGLRELAARRSHEAQAVA